MPIPAHVSREFKKSSVSDKISFGENVIDQLTDHEDTFPGPPVTLATLTATNAALSNAQAAAASGDHQKVAELRAAELIWDDQFEDTAEFVDDVADGDVADILLAGFQPTKTERTPPPLPEAPVISKVLTSQQPGGIQLQIEPMKGVRFIAVVSTSATLPDLSDGQFLAASNAHVIAVLFDCGRKVNITGLPVRSALFVSALAVNTTGFGPACPPIAANTV